MKSCYTLDDLDLETVEKKFDIKQDWTARLPRREPDRWLPVLRGVELLVFEERFKTLHFLRDAGDYVRIRGRDIFEALSEIVEGLLPSEPADTPLRRFVSACQPYIFGAVPRLIVEETEENVPAQYDRLRRGHCFISSRVPAKPYWKTSVDWWAAHQLWTLRHLERSGKRLQVGLYGEFERDRIVELSLWDSHLVLPTKTPLAYGVGLGYPGEVKTPYFPDLERELASGGWEDYPAQQSEDGPTIDFGWEDYYGSHLHSMNLYTSGQLLSRLSMSGRTCYHLWIPSDEDSPSRFLRVGGVPVPRELQ